MPSPFDPAQQNESIVAKTIFALDRVAEVFRVQLWEEAKGHGLTPLQLRLLLFVHYHELELTGVTAMAQEFQLTKPTVSETVRLLLKKKLVSKVKDPADGRGYFLKSSAAGRRVLAEVERFTQGLSASLEQLDGDGLENLYANLLALLVHLQSGGLVPLQRMCFNCRHYVQAAGVRRCSLLNIDLEPELLRLDCPEFESGGAAGK